MTQAQIAKMTVDEFVTALAAKQPVPGGGAAAACILAQASALGAMVIAYTLGKPKFATPKSPGKSRHDFYWRSHRCPRSR